MRTFFVGGIHGVGKTSSCERVALELAIPHRGASAMIKAQSASAILSNTKSVPNLMGNQELLVCAVVNYLSSSEQNLLVDGHFSVPDGDFRVSVIPLTVFRQLRLAGVAICHDEPARIQGRRISRDGSSPSIQQIAAHQRLEIEHAQFVALSLRIPFCEIAAFDTQALSKAVAEAFRDESA